MKKEEADNILTDIDEFIYEHSSGSFRPKERTIDVRNGELISVIEKILKKYVD